MHYPSPQNPVCSEFRPRTGLALLVAALLIPASPSLARGGPGKGGGGTGTDGGTTTAGTTTAGTTTAGTTTAGTTAGSTTGPGTTTTAPGGAGGSGAQGLELNRFGRCGVSSSWHLRLRSRGGTIRTDLWVWARPGKTNATTWSVVVRHERRVAHRARLRPSAGSFRGGWTVADYAGPDTVAVRAVRPDGEVCLARATLAGAPA